MKWKHAHNRNGVQHQAGDKYTGNVHSGRWLYHRGHLEPDGDPQDALITGPKVKRSAWHGANEQVDDKRPTAVTRNAPQDTAGEETEE